MLLPRMVEADPKGSEVYRILGATTRLLWPKGEIKVPLIPFTPELSEGLRSARSAGQVVRGLEGAERTLASEERGLEQANRGRGVPRGGRVSRLLLLADDGAERFYRRVETLLRRYGPRVLAVCLEVDAYGLGENLFGPGRLARLLMIRHKDAVGAILLTMAGQGKGWEDPS